MVLDGLARSCYWRLDPDETVYIVFVYIAVCMYVYLFVRHFVEVFVELCVHDERRNERDK